MLRLLPLLLLLAVTGSTARIIFVDGSLADDCVRTYDPVTRRCGADGYPAWRTLRGGAEAAIPGDTVIIRGGVYSEQLVPARSGLEQEPILYTGVNNEQAVITGAALSPAIMIEDREHITIRALVVSDVRRWAAVLGSRHITLSYNVFRNATDAGGSSKTGIFLQSSDSNVIRDNIIDNSTQDNLALIDSDHNLVEGNRITRAAHTLWAVKCGNSNVIRGNYFHNDLQKIGEIYDCDGVGYGEGDFPKITRLDSTRHNVVELNIFARTSTPVDRSPYAGIQHAGQYTIIRNNVFYDCIGPPVDLTLYSDEARYNYGNRVYNNVFYNNDFGGIAVSGGGGAGYRIDDNIVANNILYRNRFIRHDARWEWYGQLDGKPVQIITGRISEIRFERNNILDSTANQIWTIAYGDRTSATNPAPQPLSWWETNAPDLFIDNLQTDPLFVDTAARNFRLKPGSPMIDAGMFVARTVGAGSGRTMRVDDASWFRDSNGIAGLGGDTIQLEGGSGRAVITAIDYAMNMLTLDNDLVWSDGQGVSLKYNGAAPDIGAIESDEVTEVAVTADAEEITLHPNPTTGEVTITFPVGFAPFARLHVFDILGRVVSDRVWDDAQSRDVVLDLGNQRSGVYTVVIRSEEGVSARSFVKK